MTNPGPPERRPNRLRDDEPIALLVTLLAFGGIFAWAFGLFQNSTWLDAQRWLSGNFATLSAAVQGTDSKTSSATNSASVLGLTGDSSPTTSPVPQPMESPKDNNFELQGEPAESDSSIPSPSPTPSGMGGLPNSSSQVSPPPSPSATNDSIPLNVPPGEGSPAPKQTQAAVPPTLPLGTPIAFKDVPVDHWASAFIAPLSASGVVVGFKDGTFKPDEPINRSQFASYVAKTTTQPVKREFLVFKDVAKGSAQGSIIEKAVITGFMNGYADGEFRPQQLITRTEALISAVSGLDLPIPADPEQVLSLYEDRDKIPPWARAKIAAATQAGLVANYPNVAQLRPSQPATRADVATMFYQILVRKQQAQPIASKYLVRSAPVQP